MAAYLAACGGDGGGSADDRIAFKTWEDHYLPEQLKEMRRTKDITVKVSFADDNLTNFQQLKRGVDYDVVTADALWVPRFLEDGLIEPFDPAELSTWGNLYSAAREVPFWKEGSLYTCYPHAWSPTSSTTTRAKSAPAGLVGGAARPALPGQDRARQGAERHPGEGRLRDRRGQAGSP